MRRTAMGEGMDGWGYIRVKGWGTLWVGEGTSGKGVWGVSWVHVSQSWIGFLKIYVII